MKIILLFIFNLGFYLSICGQANIKDIPPPNQMQAVKIRTLSLPTTTAKLLALSPERGMAVYNTNPATTGTLAYPSIGIGMYVYDGLGWVVSKSEVLASSVANTNPGLVNAVLLLDQGDFIPPSAEQESGRYFYVRNTSNVNTITVLEVIDLGETQATAIKINPKAPAIMIYSNGKDWYRLF